MSTSRHLLVLICFLVCAACQTSVAEVSPAVSTIADMPASTPTCSPAPSTPTLMVSSPSATTTGTPTSFPAPPAEPGTSVKPAPTTESIPAPYDRPEGWQDYAGDAFLIALPERWTVVDIDSEGLDAFWKFLASLDTDWAHYMTENYSQELMRGVFLLWAMDSEFTEEGYAASMNITHHIRSQPVSVEGLCVNMPAVYGQLGLETVEANCTLVVNNLIAARFMLRGEVGSLSVMEYQYAYFDGNEIWLMTLAVDGDRWQEYEPVFSTIAESFRLRYEQDG